MPSGPTRPGAPRPSLFPAGEPGPADSPSKPRASADTITAHCDGGARGNPGPSGYGAEITDSQGNVLAELSEFLGIRTNNFAEYSGLLASLQFALDHNHPHLRVVSDSELMVKQIQGRYKVNSPDLKPLWQEAKNRIARLGSFTITHALRHKNKAADRLANEAMDRGMRKGTPAEGRPIIRSAAESSRAAGLSTSSTPAQSRDGVQSLPLRAIPYPQPGAAPTPPAQLDPAPRRAPATGAAISAPTSAVPSTPEPTMLRGFTRDGVIHILGAHNLPDGRFVKIIPE